MRIAYYDICKDLRICPNLVDTHVCPIKIPNYSDEHFPLFSLAFSNLHWSIRAFFRGDNNDEETPQEAGRAFSGAPIPATTTNRKPPQKTFGLQSFWLIWPFRSTRTVPEEKMGKPKIRKEPSVVLLVMVRQVAWLCYCVFNYKDKGPGCHRYILPGSQGNLHGTRTC